MHVTATVHAQTP